jgi:ABC-2 type transport system ATP-binding protein
MSFVNYFKVFANYENLKFKRRSGGERRLVGTYSSLNTESETVRLDEPFSHLSQRHIKNVKQLIFKEKKHKAIILYDHI